MALTITTPNMNLVLPVPGPAGQVGPTFATNINDSLSTVDLHDHSSGKGLKISPAGLNINADLTFGGFTATNLKASAYDNNTSTLTAGLNRRVFVLNGDLYYRNNSGTDVRLTNGGAIDVGSVGGITGDYSSSGAVLTYSNTAGVKAYSFLQGTPDTSTYASVLHADVSIYEKVAGANAVKLKAPTGLSASYDLTFGAALPGSGTKFVRVSSAGAITYDVDVDGSTIEISGSTLRVKASGITSNEIGNGQVTYAKLQSPNYQASGTATGNTSGGEATILTTTALSSANRNVIVLCEALSNGEFYVYGGGGSGSARWRIKRNGTEIASGNWREQSSGNATTCYLPHCFDFPGAGSWTYTLTIECSGSTNVGYTNVRLRAMES